MRSHSKHRSAELLLILRRLDEQRRDRAYKAAHRPARGRRFYVMLAAGLGTAAGILFLALWRLLP